MTKEEAIELVKQGALVLKNLDAKFKNDREIVMPTWFAQYKFKPNE